MLELLYERSEGNAFLIEEILGRCRRGPPGRVAAEASGRVAGPGGAAVGTCCRLLRVASAAGRWCPDRLLSMVPSWMSEPR